VGEIQGAILGVREWNRKAKWNRAALHRWSCRSCAFATFLADYIQNQLEHHRLRSFQEEHVGFLKKHGIGFEERYLWD
jgi:hypothetical protein